MATSLAEYNMIKTKKNQLEHSYRGHQGKRQACRCEPQCGAQSQQHRHDDDETYCTKPTNRILRWTPLSPEPATPKAERPAQDAWERLRLLQTPARTSRSIIISLSSALTLFCRGRALLQLEDLPPNRFYSSPLFTAIETFQVRELLERRRVF
ncbi:hypothetical protein K440DRAFT_642761 [Wilcoxina mikolae CBS 423.85]|nr:hypothetical protein K440DRAFT_642761 [Wilcoxina mikolae CBS 423.85]